MLVPKYKATAKRVVGVPGQQMTVKAPANLSAPQQAAAAGYERLGTEAAKWGQVAYSLHRSGVIAAEKSKYEAQVDDMFIEAQQRPVHDPDYMEKGGILGWFDDQVSALGKTVGTGVFDPLTRMQVRSNYVGYLSDARSKLSTYYAGRLTNAAAANVARDTEDYTQRAANALPVNWDGDEATLPLAVIENMNAITLLQDNAANTGVIQFTAAQTAKETMRSDIAVHAVNTRNLMARTADQVEELLTQMENPDNFRWLDVKDRDRFLKQLETKKYRLLRDEQAEEEATRREEARRLNADQNARHNRLILKDDLTLEDVENAVNQEPNQQGLKPSATSSLRALALKEGPADSDPVFKTSLYTDLVTTASDTNLAPSAKADSIDALIQKASRTVGLGRESLLTHSDFTAFIKYAQSIRSEERDGGEVARVLRDVRAAAGETPFGIEEDKAPRVMEATRVYMQAISTGATPPEAAQFAIDRITAFPEEQPLFRPTYLPMTIPNHEFPADPRKWTTDDILAAKNYATRHRARLGAQKYQEMMKGIRAVEAYQSAVALKEQRKN